MQYKEETLEKLQKEEIWDIVCTHAVGMVCSLTFYLNCKCHIEFGINIGT